MRSAAHFKRLSGAGPGRTHIGEDEIVAFNNLAEEAVVDESIEQRLSSIRDVQVGRSSRNIHGGILRASGRNYFAVRMRQNQHLYGWTGVQHATNQRSFSPRRRRGSTFFFLNRPAR